MKRGSWVYVNGRLGIYLRAGRPKHARSTEIADATVGEVHFVNALRETVSEEWVPLESIVSAGIHDEAALMPALEALQ